MSDTGEFWGSVSEKTSSFLGVTTVTSKNYLDHQQVINFFESGNTASKTNDALAYSEMALGGLGRFLKVNPYVSGSIFVAGVLTKFEGDRLMSALQKIELNYERGLETHGLLLTYSTTYQTVSYGGYVATVPSTSLNVYQANGNHMATIYFTYFGF